MDKFWLILNLIAALSTITICVKYFIKNHTFKKWLRIYEAGIVSYYAIIYILILIGVINIKEYANFLRPVASILLLIPLLEATADRWRTWK